MWAGTCHTAVPFIGWAVATWVFPHSEACWELILQNVSTVTSMGLLENFKQREVLHHQQNARSGPRLSCNAAVPDCQETHWTMRWFRVAPPLTQNSQEVRTCCIRMCRRAKKRSVVKGFCTFRKACVCPLEDRHEGARYLGQKKTFEEQETAEIRNRLKAA